MEIVRTSARCGLATFVALLLTCAAAHSAGYDESVALPGYDPVCESADDGEFATMSDEPCCWIYYLGEWWCVPC